ncbi:MAG: R3H domain-containing nucleic acid-binding protein [bacterium]|nr:R3H domain-containing nucleic acid-binding protein [bacterium]
MTDQSPTASNQQETLRKTAEALLRLMGFFDISVSLRQNAPDEPLTVAVSTDNAGMLIGEQGTNLRAFEYVTKLIVRRMLPEGPRFIIDINNYREERVTELRSYAREVASKVAREGQQIELEPMSSYERRIIHSELTAHPDITTESTGDGLERRVVVKPLQQ